MEEQEVLNVGDLLNGTIVNEINNVNEERDPGARKHVIDGIEKLYKLRIEESKAADDFYNNEKRRNMEKETQDSRNALELEIHRDKMKIEAERLKLEKENMEQDIEIKRDQAKTEKKKMWLDIGTKTIAVAAWLIVSYKVMHVEEFGSVRSKAFSGKIPKFW